MGWIKADIFVLFLDHLVEIQTHGWLCSLWQKNHLPSNQHHPPLISAASEPEIYGLNKRSRALKQNITGRLWWDTAGAYYSLSSAPSIQCCVSRPGTLYFVNGTNTVLYGFYFLFYLYTQIRGCKYTVIPQMNVHYQTTVIHNFITRPVLMHKSSVLSFAFAHSSLLGLPYVFLRTTCMFTIWDVSLWTAEYLSSSPSKTCTCPYVVRFMISYLQVKNSLKTVWILKQHLVSPLQDQLILSNSLFSSGAVKHLPLNKLPKVKLPWT